MGAGAPSRCKDKMQTELEHYNLNGRDWESNYKRLLYTLVICKMLGKRPHALLNVYWNEA